VSHVIASGDRRRAGATAPAEGLCLWRVHYPQDPFRGLSGGRGRPYPEQADYPAPASSN
jgi:hypothetical protein